MVAVIYVYRERSNIAWFAVRKGVLMKITGRRKSRLLENHYHLVLCFQSPELIKGRGPPKVIWLVVKYALDDVQGLERES